MSNQKDWDALLQKQANPQHRAPYNFISPPEKVAATPWAEGDAALLNAGNPTHAKPLKNSINGVLNINWLFEQDFLIGGEGTQANQQAHYCGKPVLPGSSIRGMLRNVLEITTASRVEHMDREAQFAFRTWEKDDKLAKMWLKHLMPNGAKDAPVIRAGLLMPPPKGDKDDPYEGWRLVPGSIARLHEDDGFRCLGRARPDEWDGMSPNARYQYFAQTISNDIACRVGKRQTYGLGLEWQQAIPENCPNPKYPIVNSAQKVTGRIGLVGLAEEIMINNKPTINDSWIFAYNLRKDDAVTLPKEVVKKFILTHNAIPKADNALNFWLERYKDGHSCEIPVTYISPPSIDDTLALKSGKISLGLSRAMKLPHACNVGQVAQKSGDAYLRNASDHLDFAQALFGHVPGVDADDNKPTYLEDKPEKKSWKSRIFIRHADLKQGQALEQYTLTGIIANSPKASFAPNYLRSDDLQSEHHWSDDKVKLAGRKRYPVRKQKAIFPGMPVRSENLDALNNQQQGGVQSSAAFSKASVEKPVVFSGPIRLHNLHPIEFGALLWVLGFGENIWNHSESTTYRHAMGRGKPQGYGRVKAQIASAALQTPMGDGVDMSAFADYLTMFETWMAAQNVEGDAPEGAALKFENLTHIQELLAMADPEIGDAAHDVLNYISQGTGDDASIKGHMTIKSNNQKRNKGAPLVMLPKYPRQRKPS